MMLLMCRNYHSDRAIESSSILVAGDRRVQLAAKKKPDYRETPGA
jgi:hypothetical protein